MELKNKIHYICLGIIFIIIFILAWQCDDAYHGHRMSWNLLNGHGFVYNAGERVTASTAPLFTLMTTLIFVIIRDVYWASLILSFICSIAAIYLMQRRLANNSEIVLSTIILLFSMSFVSFTTSGVENPMLFLWSAIAVIIFFNHDEFDSRTLLLLSFVSSLLITTRMDNALIVFPLLVYAFFIKSKKKILAILCGFAGMMPFISWTLFSFIYYGFPFPNTAYAKLNTGFPFTDYLERGVRYFVMTLLYDPLVLILPLVYIFFAIYRKNTKHIMLASGFLLYYAYIIYIGGDFMLGRHYTVCFFLSATCIFDLLKTEKIWKVNKIELKYNVPVIMVLLVCALLQGPIMSSFFHPLIPTELVLGNRHIGYPDNGINNTRSYYFASTSIIGRERRARELGISSREDATLSFWLLDEYEKAREESDIGALVFRGSGVIVFEAKDYYMSDNAALGDPLLARLPAERLPNWRIGHMTRHFPAGYKESIQTGENRIVDPSLREYYEVLRLITRSEDLFAPERIRAIIDMNLGRYDYLIEDYISAAKSP